MRDADFPVPGRHLIGEWPGLARESFSRCLRYLPRLEAGERVLVLDLPPVVFRPEAMTCRVGNGRPEAAVGQGESRGASARIGMLPRPNAGFVLAKMPCFQSRHEITSISIRPASFAY